MTSEPLQNTTIFVVDDEQVVRDALSAVVDAIGFSVQCFPSASEFLKFINLYEIAGPVCLIADIQMPEMSGIELLEQLRILGRNFPVILMTGAGGDSIQSEAEALGAAAFLEKPFRSAQLQEAITTILHRPVDQQIAL